MSQISTGNAFAGLENLLDQDTAYAYQEENDPQENKQSKPSSKSTVKSNHETIPVSHTIGARKSRGNLMSNNTPADNKENEIPPYHDAKRRLKNDLGCSSASNKSRTPIHYSRDDELTRGQSEKRPKVDRHREAGRKRSHSPFTECLAELHKNKIKHSRTPNSIVGSRPQHWRRNETTTESFAKTTPRNRKDVLAKAVSKSFSLIQYDLTAHREISPPKRSKPRRSSSSFNSVNLTTHSHVTPKHHSDKDVGMNFRPAVLAQMISTTLTKSNNTLHPMNHSIDMDPDVLIIGDDDDHSLDRGNIKGKVTIPSFKVQNVGTSRQLMDKTNVSLFSIPQNEAVESPPVEIKSKKAQSKLGVLSKRLKGIRDNIKGDLIRFQSGQYPFVGRSIRKDSHDPRSRASNYIDVLVHSEPLPFKNLSEHLVMVLGYVHSTFHNNFQFSDTNQINQTREKSEFAWILFSVDTAQEHKISKGTELRIYNSIWLSIDVSTDKNECKKVTDPSDSVIKNRTTVRWMIACTQLCEKYPSDILPPLSMLQNSERGT